MKIGYGTILKPIMFHTINYTTEDTQASDVFLAPERLKRVKTQEQEDGGGKALTTENADCMLKTNNTNNKIL